MVHWVLLMGIFCNQLPLTDLHDLLEVEIKNKNMSTKLGKSEIRKQLAFMLAYFHSHWKVIRFLQLK